MIENARINCFIHVNIEKILSVCIQKPVRLILNKRELGKRIAKICGDCGYVEFFISKAPALKDV
jgi:hypothetical protein